MLSHARLIKFTQRVLIPLVNLMANKITRYLRFLLSALLGLMAVACSVNPPSPILAFFFDVPASGQAAFIDAPPRGPRHTARADLTPQLVVSKEYIAMIETMVNAGPPPNWPEVFNKLPKDDEDNIDWMAALQSKVISPSGIINTGDQDIGKTSDDDIELSTSGKPNRMVIFSHKVHTQWLTCTNCHNAIFKREAGSAQITMDAIDEGKYCGVCHDKVALAQPSGCKGCHKPIKKS